MAHRILSENYESVVAAQNMKESLERQDSAALFALLGQDGSGAPAAPGTSAALRRRVRARREQPHRAGRGADHRCHRGATVTRYYRAFDRFMAALLLWGAARAADDYFKLRRDRGSTICTPTAIGCSI